MTPKLEIYSSKWAEIRTQCSQPDAPKAELEPDFLDKNWPFYDHFSAKNNDISDFFFWTAAILFFYMEKIWF